MCSGSFLESHTRRCPTKWHCSWPTPPLPASSACLLLLAWCGLAAPLSTSTAERTDLQGFGTMSTRRAGPTLQLQGRLARRRAHNNNNNTTHCRDDDAIATGLEADLLPRPGLCSPSPMAQAEPSMACNASSSTQSLLPAELPKRPGQAARELSLALTLSLPPAQVAPPARVAPPAPSLALQSAGNAHVDGWRVTFTPTGWQASHRVQSDRTPAATESL